MPGFFCLVDGFSSFLPGFLSAHRHRNHSGQTKKLAGTITG
jgi:hypothetical protein